MLGLLHENHFIDKIRFEKYMSNKLIYEKSPYLLQHAQNPVDWYAWGEEALQRAQQENKPILVSIGYSTCHWCHVMEHESFENADIAAVMNENFINIKIDREERPDLDQIYMEACQLISGSGGWPLNCFLLPDGRPFFAGTYYPPRPAYNRPSWGQVLQNIARAFRDQPEVVEDQAQRLMNLMKKSDAQFIKNEWNKDFTEGGASTQNKEENLVKMAKNILQGADRKQGGFGRAPKFPHAMTIQFLLTFYKSFETKKEYEELRQDALQQACLALDKMILGGIYDQLGGGFARYSVDNEWLVPHFEKMLYDNALLIVAMADAYKLTKKALYKETIIETVNFVLWEMMSPQFGFYSAFDADSEGEEGKFYVWSKTEIDENLGAAAQLFSKFYGVTEGGNFEGHNILFRKNTLTEFCLENNLDENATRHTLQLCKARLLEVRDERVPPSLDDKMLTSWNALMISALVRAHEALGENDENGNSYIREELRKPLKINDFKDIAILTTEFALHHLFEDGELRHACKGSESYGIAFLEDYAYLATALIDVYQISFDEKYLQKAKDLTEKAIVNFWDKTDNLFFFTPENQKDVVLRKKDLYDNATPSANAMMLGNLQRLSVFFDNENYCNLAVKMYSAVADTVRKYPTSFSQWALSAVWQTFGATEIAIVGKNANALVLDCHKVFIKNKILMAATEGGQRWEKYPLLKGRFIEGKTLIYVCKNFACQSPVEKVGLADL